MAKETGLGWTALNVDDDTGNARDIRNDITNFDFATPYNTQEVTGIDKYAMERLALLADLTGTMNGVFNPAAQRAHAVFSGDLRVARTWGITISAQILSAEVLLTDYNLTRAAGGEFTWQVPFALQNGTVPDWTV
jgi:hypothetical protein